MAQSFFRYNLSRRFPFGWFTYAVLIGGILLLALFSALNFSANAYELKVVYTNDTNSTLKQSARETRWPISLMGKLEGSCTAREIPLGARLYTDKFSLPYRLDHVARLRKGDGDQGSPVILPSLRYLDSTLDDCRVYNMQLELLAEDRIAAQFGYTQWGPKIMASVSCLVETGNDRMLVNMSTEYDLIPPTIENGQQTQLLQLDMQNRASLWWGEPLSYLMPQPDRRPFNSISFFETRYHFIFKSNPNESAAILADNQADTHRDMTNWIEDEKLPRIWEYVDKYGKSFYSTVLADLGQGKGPNILLPEQEDLLQEYTEIITGRGKMNAAVGPADASYRDSRNREGMGKLEITPSKIHSQYMCQVPQMKPVGPLIIAILVADIVLMRLAWTMLMIGATYLVEKRDTRAMCCEGHVHVEDASDGMASRDFASPLPYEQVKLISPPFQSRGYVG